MRSYLSELIYNFKEMRLPRSAKDDSWRSARCLFILSTGRTGSSTLIKLLNLSPDVNAFHEPKPNLVKEYRSSFRDMSDRPDYYRRLFMRARSLQISQSTSDGSVYAEATLLKFFAPVIAQLLPNSKFLHIHRHPGEVVRSGMRRRWYLNNPLDKYRAVPVPSDPASSKWVQWDSFNKVCWLWHAENQRFLELAQSLGGERVLSLQFDNWINPQTGQYQIIFDFLGVKQPKAGIVSEILGEKHNRQVDGEFPHYELWTESQKHKLHEIASSTMDQLGYNEISQSTRLAA